MGVFPLAAQNAALAYPEPMLLVDDPKTEPPELDPLLKNGMGADDDMRLAIADHLQHLTFIPVRHRTGKKNRLEPKGLQPSTELDEMLLGQDLRRCDDGDLGVVFYSDEGGHQGDDRLSASDIPLEETVHRVGLHEIVLDLSEDPALGVGEGPGEHAGERLRVAVGHLKGNSLFKDNPASLEGKAELEEKEFVVNEGAAGRIGTPLKFRRRNFVSGKMSLPKGHRQGKKIATTADICRNG
jgi:hypothetical protein